jgi:H+/Cl- antiporter ClcA
MENKHQGDFTAQPRLLIIALLAVGIGVLCAVVARVLLWLIAFFTNLFYFQQISVAEASPAEAIEHLGWISIFIPAAGGLIIGLMARYGSERIRGHGIPEALEAILIGRSRMQPKVAVLKPLSSAVSIGSGGPFGAEGPIIMTGGACGSIIAQVFNLTSAERKALLVAGAAGGMSATFATPVAAVMLAVELLLFEWKPRSLIPVALASAAAMLVRPLLLDSGPLFPIAVHEALSPLAVTSSAILGLVAGVVALALTYAVYAAEDGFHRLPIHWMWWPAIGGLAVGIGGLIQPRALGVGYDIIRDLLHGDIPVGALLVLVVVKSVIWATSLGSGTSGGVLAPLLIMGGAAGALASAFLPNMDPRLGALIGMSAIMGGTMRSPFTGVIFALELTQDINALPALLLATIVAYAFTVLVMRRSILTEKVARRGFHVSREYSVDPLELTSIEEVMTAEVVAIPGSMPVRELLGQHFQGVRKHQAYPVVDPEGNLLGVITRANLLDEWVLLNTGGPEQQEAGELIVAYDLVQREPIVAYPWESCRTAALRMAQHGVGRLPVMSTENPRKVIGIVSRSDLLKPRARQVEEELQRERFIGGQPVPKA